MALHQGRHLRRGLDDGWLPSALDGRGGVWVCVQLPLTGQCQRQHGPHDQVHPSRAHPSRARPARGP
ncbi:Hypothetical protein AA314_03263 [Archangium gephyra]|uniref:Uncharacterized protein n=1 Tax=Archangium gephyra TaxID=48 RepID=A0AAC8TD49_9BACT|nr:Hypothetical protein AA314_03263 [Archangium gephyra]